MSCKVNHISMGSLHLENEDMAQLMLWVQSLLCNMSRTRPV
jgi:hypothetical protein